MLMLPENEIVVTFDKEKFIAFRNRCPHKGYRVYTEFCGFSEHKCPYHGMDQRREELQVQNVRGWIFVGIAPVHFLENQIDIGDLPENIHERFKFYKRPIYSEWRVCVENALESLHVPHVHKNTFSNGFSAGGIENFRKFSSQWKTKFKFRDYTHNFFFPFTCLTTLEGYTTTVQHYLQNDALTHFTCKMYSFQETPKITEELSSEFNERVFEEDARICEGVPKYFQGPTMPGEKRVDHFRKLMTSWPQQQVRLSQPESQCGTQGYHWHEDDALRNPQNPYCLERCAAPQNHT